MLNTKFPENVFKVFQTFNNFNYEVYLVGGSLRDLLLGSNPHDWDFTTNCYPEEVKKIFPKTFDTGLKHGTVTVLINGESFEITTYRVDGDYRDGRRPEKISYTNSLERDLRRRDFTINAMAYHPSTGLVDPFGGSADLQAKVIRAVGTPGERFREDALRMLRAIRFGAKLGFTIEAETYAAIGANCQLITKISAERIREELNKILLSQNPDYIRKLREVGLLQYFIPELETTFTTSQNHPFHIYNVGDHLLATTKEVTCDLVLRLTMLFHDIGKPLVKTTDEAGVDHFHGHGETSMALAKEILKRLKYDNKTIGQVSQLIKYHDYPLKADQKLLRRLAAKLGAESIPRLLEVKRADAKGQNPRFLKEKLNLLDLTEGVYGEIVKEKQCLSRKDLAVNGFDLLKQGFKGKEIKLVLNKLLEAVIDKPELNTWQQLTEISMKIYNELRKKE